MQQLLRLSTWHICYIVNVIMPCVCYENQEDIYDNVTEAGSGTTH
jgi:hypothetical protein